MKKERNHQIKLGFMVTAALALFIISIYYLGRKQSLFQSVIRVYSKFSDVKGLLVGNNVRFSGINVGTVSGIQIINDSTILVEFSINDRASEFIRNNAMVSIDNEGIMGNKILVVGSGTPEAPKIQNRDTLPSLPSLDIENIVSEAKQIVSQSRTVTENLAEISDKINNGQGDLGKLINQSQITVQLDSLGRNALTALNDINDITGKIRNGTGDVGSLIYDDQLTERMDKILKKLDSVSDKADNLTYQLSVAANEINNGNGLIHRLLYDSTLADNIDTTILKINSGIDDVIGVADVVESSWLLNLFRKKKNSGKKKEG